MLGRLRALLHVRRRTKRAIVIAADILLCALAVWLAFSLRLGTWWLDTPPVLNVFAVALVTFLPIFHVANVYRTIFRFAGLQTIGSIGVACTIIAVPFVLVFMILGMNGVPRTIGLLFPLIFFLLVSLSRIVARYLFVEIMNQRDFAGPINRVLIYGAGYGGQQLARSLRMEPAMRLRGLIDDDPKLDGQRLEGVPVFAASRLAELIKDLEIDTILLAMPTLTRSRQKQIVEKLQQYEVHVLTLPSITQLVGGQISVNDLREIAVEDLLGREPVAPDEQLLGETIVGKTVLVTGAGGSIGGELCRQILAIGAARLVAVDMTEHALYTIEAELTGIARAMDRDAPEIFVELANVASDRSIGRIIDRYRPHTIFHAAAYKHVPLVEGNVLESLKNNVKALLCTALAAERAGTAHFILISTDKAVRPTNVMGASKRVCELVLQALSDRGSETRFAMVRFGNVLGSSGSVVPLFRAQIANGGPVTLTHRDITRYFMTMAEAAQLVIQAGAMASGGEVYVLDMGKPVLIADMARAMIHLSGLSIRNANNPDGDIEIVEIGLRPGEKLHEELLIGNDPEATSHPRIMRSREIFQPWSTLEILLDELMAAETASDEPRALAILAEIVPEYRPERGGASSADAAGAGDREEPLRKVVAH